jgi:alpha-glucosidase
VVDYRDIEPSFGTLDQAERVIAKARAIGIRTIVDIVPNHVSAQHRWFRDAVAAGPGSPERERFWFRPGVGLDGEQPPNGWQSIFGGPAWTRTKGEEGSPGEWYLHLFTPEQPDLNWNNPDVWLEHEDILRFWFDRGVAGVRIDSAALLVKDPDLAGEEESHAPGEHPFTDRDQLHEVYRRWRAVADSYDEPRVLVGELWLPDVERFARYLRPDELHTAFNFDFLACPWEPDRIRTSIESTLAAHAPVDAPSTWVLSNHDVTRPVTRYGRADTSFSFDAKREGTRTDLVLGVRRARAAALLAMALPGSMYIYQGEELGLPEVEDIPGDQRQDPMYFRSGGVDPGRDGCRVPMPWSGDEPPYGFGPNGARPAWLAQPPGWAGLTVAAQSDDAASMLALYRAGLALRRSEPALHGGTMTWWSPRGTVLRFARGSGFVCIVNFGPGTALVPLGATVLLASSDLDGRRIPPDTTVWVRVPSATAVDPADQESAGEQPRIPTKTPTGNRRPESINPPVSTNKE